MSLEEEVWSKLSAKGLDGHKRYSEADICIWYNFTPQIVRDKILYEVAIELELLAISLSSTVEGYGQRIHTMKDGIQALSQLERWDGNDRDFEDSQDVIQILRRFCVRNGKGRLFDKWLNLSDSKPVARRVK